MLLAASPAQASFGLERFDVAFANPPRRAPTPSRWPPASTSSSKSGKPDEEFKGGTFEQIAGLIADPGAVPRCSTVDFLTIVQGVGPTRCPDSAAVGTAATKIQLIDDYNPLYNLEPPPGVILKLGFIAGNTPITIEVGLKDRPPYNGRAIVTNTPQTAGVLKSVLTLWGDPRIQPTTPSAATASPAGCMAKAG